MIYGLINEYVSLPQLSELCPDNSYHGLNITKSIIIPLDINHLLEEDNIIIPLEETDEFHQSQSDNIIIPLVEMFESHQPQESFIRNAVLDVLLSEKMHQGDILLTSTLLNLSSVSLHNSNHPVRIIGDILDQGIRVISILEKFDSDDYDKETFVKISSLTKRLQLESRRLMAQKQKKGIAKAHATGRYTDRSFKPSDFPEFDLLYQLYQDNRISKLEMAKRLSISRPTLDKLFLIRQHELERNKESNAKRSE